MACRFRAAETQCRRMLLRDLPLLGVCHNHLRACPVTDYASVSTENRTMESWTGAKAQSKMTRMTRWTMMRRRTPSKLVCGERAKVNTSRKMARRPMTSSARSVERDTSTAVACPSICSCPPSFPTCSNWSWCRERCLSDELRAIEISIRGFGKNSVNF